MGATPTTVDGGKAASDGTYSHVPFTSGAESPHWNLDLVRELVAADAVFIYQGRAVRFFENYSACHVAVQERFW